MQHFEDRVFNHSPFRQKSQLQTLSTGVCYCEAMLLRSRAVYHPDVICVQMQYQVHLLIRLIFQLSLKRYCARNTTNTWDYLILAP